MAGDDARSPTKVSVKRDGGDGRDGGRGGDDVLKTGHALAGGHSVPSRCCKVTHTHTGLRCKAVEHTDTPGEPSFLFYHLPC